MYCIGSNVGLVIQDMNWETIFWWWIAKQTRRDSRINFQIVHTLRKFNSSIDFLSACCSYLLLSSIVCSTCDFFSSVATGLPVHGGAVAVQRSSNPDPRTAQVTQNESWKRFLVFMSKLRLPKTFSLTNSISNMLMQERQPRVRTSGNPGRSRDIFKPPTPEGDLPPYSPNLS